MLDKVYRSKKSKGLIKIVKVSDKYFVESTSFDPDTGEQQPQQLIPLNPVEVAKRIAELKSTLKELQEVEKDIEALG